jgi:hypothetical protein
VKFTGPKGIAINTALTAIRAANKDVKIIFLVDIFMMPPLSTCFVLWLTIIYSI